MDITLPQNVTYIPYSDFSSDGYYSLLPGETKIFPWEVKPSEQTIITMVQSDSNTQDHSLQAWLSTRPLDDVMFWNISYMNYIDVKRTDTTVAIYDSSLKKPLVLSAPAKTSYYLNIKNMSNEPNGFRLIFSFSSAENTPSTTNNKPSTSLTPSTPVGTQTIYGVVVAQLPDSLTLVKSKSGDGDTYSLMFYDTLIASVTLKPSSIKGIEAITATYCDGSNPKIQGLHYMMEWLKDQYSLMSIQLYDASTNKVFWDTLVEYPGFIKFVLWDKNTGARISLNSDMLICDTLWERDPNLIILI